MTAGRLCRPLRQGERRAGLEGISSMLAAMSLAIHTWRQERRGSRTNNNRMIRHQVPTPVVIRECQPGGTT